MAKLKYKTNPEETLKKELKAGKIQTLFLIGSVLLVFLLLSIFVDNFLSSNNILNLLGQVAPIGIMACGLTVVMLTGGIDISLPSVMAMSSVFGVAVMAQTGSGLLGSIVIIIIAAFVGLFNGFAVAYLKMVPMVVTLATMTICAGLATAYTDGLSIVGVPNAYLDLFSKYFVIVLFVLVVIVYTFVIKKTTFGRWLYCIGNNENTARVSGIPTKLAKLMAYMLAGISASLAGLINVAAIAGARDSMGPDSQIIEIVTSTVIGGVAISGGSGSPAGAALGAILIIVINNVFNLINVSDFYTSLIKGMIMILAIAIDAIRNRSRYTR